MKLRNVFLVFSLLSSFTALANAKFPASRNDNEGWMQVRVGGDPFERGSDYAVLIAEEIDEFISMLQVYLLKTTKKDWNFYRKVSKEIFLSKLPASNEYRQEMEGIASGLRSVAYNYDVIDIIALNSFMEISEYYLPSVEPHLGIKPKLSCSAFVATGSMTRDGQVVMGHNTWTDYIVGQRVRVILDITPSNGYAIQMQTFPGFIHSGTDFSVNTAGLVVTETTIGNFKGFDTKGTAEFIRARKAVQYSSNIDDFYKIMRDGNNGGYANTWLVADINTNEIAKLELGLINTALYRTKDGYYHGENYVDDSKMILQEAGPTLWDTNSSWPFKLNGSNTITARSLRWEAVLSKNKGKITAELGKAFLADQIEESTGKFTPGGLVLMARMEVTDIPEMPGAPAPRAFGANDAKVIDANLARSMSFWARLGHPDGSAYNFTKFWNEHPEYAWQAPYLQAVNAYQWALFQYNASSVKLRKY